MSRAYEYEVAPTGSNGFVLLDRDGDVLREYDPEQRPQDPAGVYRMCFRGTGLDTHHDIDPAQWRHIFAAAEHSGGSLDWRFVFTRADDDEQTQALAAAVRSGEERVNVEYNGLRVEAIFDVPTMKGAACFVVDPLKEDSVRMVSYDVHRNNFLFPYITDEKIVRMNPDLPRFGFFSCPSTAEARELLGWFLTETRDVPKGCFDYLQKTCEWGDEVTFTYLATR